MANRARLDWQGDQLLEQLRRAAIAAIDETTDAAAADAKASHWWINRTNRLQDEIVAGDAVIEPGQVVGKFGTTRRRGFYGLFLEYQTPFLRPAADRHFPTLGEKIARRLAE